MSDSEPRKRRRPGDRTTDVETQLRAKFRAAFGRAEFPVGGPMGLIPVLPHGPATEFRAGPVSISAIEVGVTYGQYLDFPYDDVDPLVDDLMDGLRAEDTV